MSEYYFWLFGLFNIQNKIKKKRAKARTDFYEEEKKILLSPKIRIIRRKRFPLVISLVVVVVDSFRFNCDIEIIVHYSFINFV